ncbi:Lrp/AsnC family transcriptional regulator [Halorussus litoreus]|uniref:Lrp/AsnC family transcriptional regulator n=1 Tax=Halorussus litoreus TaxID=1710536 RepID=UPI000E21F82A|nr:Lrp/AsnC family transcriptional regulator [Halorussus litoreus]
MENTDRPVADLDDVDLQLLERIEDDFDVNLEELSEELGFSKSAIHYRLNKLREKDVITDVSADLDPLAFGLNMMMLSDVSVTHDTGYADQIGSKLTDIDGVQQVYYTMGDVDFVVVSRVQNRDQMNRLVDDIVAIDGVNETSSQFVMKELKTDSNTVADLSEDMKEAVVTADE